MSNIVQELERLNQNLICLQKTRKLSVSDLELPEWYELDKAYKAARDPIHKIIISIRNSILYQKRVVFALSRDSLRDLVRADENWKPRAGFDNNAYKKVIKLLVDSCLVEVIKPASRGTPFVLKVVKNDVLQYLIVDVSKQMNEALEFASKFEKADQLPDQLSDVVRSMKKEESSKQSSEAEKPSALKLQAVPLSAEIRSNSESVLPLVNQEHQEMLSRAVAADPVNKFLADKQEKLNRFGHFTSNQLNIIQKIAETKKPGNSSDTEKLKAEQLSALKALVTTSTVTATDVIQFIRQGSFKKVCKPSDVAVALTYSGNPIVCEQVIKLLELQLSSDCRYHLKQRVSEYNQEINLNKQNRA